MVVGLGADLLDVAHMEAEFRDAEPGPTPQRSTDDESPSVAHARGASSASVVRESSP